MMAGGDGATRAASEMSADQEEDEQKRSDAKAVAKFIKDTPGLDKPAMGEYLGKGPVEQYPFISMVLEEYVNTFDFSGCTIDQAMRTFLGHFKLPGEAQCISRLMEAFARRLFADLGPGKPFKSKDAAFVLAYSIIMLNTDLHNPQNQKRMKKEEFIHNNREINEGENLPPEYLRLIYDQIKERQIQVDFDIIDAAGGVVDYSETSTWDALLRRSAADQAPAAFTPTVAARQWLRQSGVLRPSVHDRDMFLVMAKPVLKTVFMVWDPTDHGKLIFRMLEGMLDYASACVHFDLRSLLDMLVGVLVERVKATALVPQFTVHKGKRKEIPFKPMKLTDVDPFFGADFEHLISSRRVSKPQTQFQEKQQQQRPVDFAFPLRSELMLKTCIEICIQHCAMFGKTSWEAFFDLMKWARSKKVCFLTRLHPRRVLSTLY